MGRFSFRKFIVDQLEPVPPVEACDLSGKTVLVVGANVGIGFETAKHFAAMGPANLVLACRSLKKGEDAARAITVDTGFKGIFVRQVDLSVSESVIVFAEAVELEFKTIDIYVYNAATLHPDYGQTSDGWERTLQVNHISCVSLTVLLWKCLLRAYCPGNRPRAVIVSSDVHYWTTFDSGALCSPNIIEKLNEEEYCASAVMERRYSDSKLLNVLFVRELAALIPFDSPVIPVAVTPGYCKSSLRRNYTLLSSIFDSLMERVLARTAEEGARQLVWAAVGGARRENELRGAYVADAGLKEVSDFVLSEEGEQVQKRVWEETMRILSTVSPRFVEAAGALSTHSAA
ncbi:short-chain dehydrogenase [Auriscalpium vulgare]|uniref:Short-chain dehydrogenase n=1 Tax=Auriscalpium vulgare TaxID=40419 RepID=A0ACB8RRG5_9AGAM|nr:short-chain dehydrogenase [Auriscalpium vulgare]